MPTNAVARLPIEISYKQLCNPEFLQHSYEAIKSNPGNSTPGADKETLDGISKEWLGRITNSLKDRSFQFRPVRRILIPKSNGKMRPLGIPSPRDKIIQHAFKTILEAIYEPIFKDTSHGFRPGRSTHTAISEVRKWSGTTWVIEGDIKGFFDNINHHTLEALLKREIKDQNLIDLYWKLARAGYISEEGRQVTNNLGVPQGGIISPTLSNIYLHEFDKFMEEIIAKYSTPGRRVSRHNPEYARLKKLGDKEALKKVPSMIRDDTTGTRVRYNRYADDWIIGVSGSLELTKKIKEEAKEFLAKTLDLELSEEKTLISHLTTKRAKYLGFEIGRRPRSYTESLIRTTKTKITRRASNTRIQVYAPIGKIVEKLISHGFAKDKNTPKAITKWIYLEPQEIIQKYNAVLRGLLNYYHMVENRNLFTHVVWILKFSAAFTLARKLNISPKAVFKKFGKNLTTTVQAEGKKKEKVISFDAPESLRRDRSMRAYNSTNFDPFRVKYYSVRSKATWDEPCRICGSTEQIEMHHVKHIRKGNVTGFTKIMSQLNRKQIPVCRKCHMNIHNGRYDGISLKDLAQ